MLKLLLRFRFIYVIVVFFTLINSVFLLAAGAVKSIQAYKAYFELWKTDSHIRPGIYIMESLDLFMIALVFLIFGLGIMKIFTHYHLPNENLPRWLQINDFKELKISIWETILITLLVISLETVVRNMDSMSWNLLILPSVILVLSISLYLMTRGHKQVP